jgi:hypothetical protein
MKHLLIFVFTIFQIGFSYSQIPGGGGGNRQMGGRPGLNNPPQRNNEEKKVFEVPNVNDAAGLIFYDPNVVIKEIKVKDVKDKELITQLITEYNQKITQIEKTNKVKLETIELTSREKQKIAIEKNDHIQLMKIGKYMNEELHPIKMEVMEAEKVLNSKIQSSFSEKINKKWIKYFEKKKEATQPKQPKNNNNRLDLNSNPNNRMQ